MSNQEPNPMSEYYIAYFDILGYQDFFKETPEKASEFLNTLHSAIAETKKRIEFFNNSQLIAHFSDLQIESKIFSDNILLCIKTDSDIKKEKMRLILFMSIIAEIQRKFILQHSLFIRGGFTKGLLSLNEDYVFGEGLIEAVKLEEKASHPRIMVSEKIINYIYNNQLYSQEEADKAISIENKSKNNEQLSEGNLLFYQNLLELARQELLTRMFGSSLLYKHDDNVSSLSYLYCGEDFSNIPKETMEQIKVAIHTFEPENSENFDNLSPNFNAILGIHKDIVEQKLIKYSDYSSFETDDIKSFEIRERILKKYVWAMVYHNKICRRHNKLEHFINTRGNCESRHMKLQIQLIDENGNIINQ